LLVGFVNFLVSHRMFYKMLEEVFGYQKKLITELACKLWIY
jgi:hypothetical protein